MKCEKNASICAVGLEKNYGYMRALRGVDLNIKAGESWSIFGPNGAGKTTLIGILSLLTKPTGGMLKIHGLEAENDETRLRKQIGVISHQTFLYGDLTAYENLIFFGRLYGVPDVKVRTRFMLREMGLKDWAGERVRNFSRGMQQRLAIARALLHEPSILLLDEPFTGLDQVGVRQFQGMLQRFRTKHRIILITSHNLSLGAQGCTHVAILNSGVLVYRASEGELRGVSLEEIYFQYVDW
jgi:heme exporter protein A